MIRILIGGAGIAALALGGYWSARLALADLIVRGGTDSQLPAAIRLDPGNVQLLGRQAHLDNLAGRDPEPLIRQALASNRYDARLWIQLALRAERLGDFARAEQMLDQARAVSRQFEPRWVHASYWFRRGDRARFHESIRDALPMGHSDLRPVFTLCRRIGLTNAEIQGALPPQRPDLRRAYCEFLIDGGDLDDAHPMAMELTAYLSPNAIAPYLRLTSLLLARESKAEALALWNSLARHGLIPYPAQQEAAVTNGDFRNDSLYEGFDWRVPEAAGIMVLRLDDPPLLKISLSGKQPDRTELLWQPLPVERRSRYRLRYLFKTSGVRHPESIRWSVRTGQSVDFDSSLPSAAERWTEGSLEFRATSGLMRLALSYRRPEGVTRTEGAVLLREVRIEEIP